MKPIPATSPWKTHFGGAAIILGLTVVTYFARISPTLSRHELAQGQTLQLDSERSKSREMERSLLSLKDQVEKAQANAAASQLKLEPASELNQRLARLTDLAAANKLHVDTIESGATTAFERYSTIAIRIGGRGTYRNCAAALANIRAAMPDVGVVSFQMSSAGVNADATATFGLELFWHTQPISKFPKK